MTSSIGWFPSWECAYIHQVPGSERYWPGKRCGFVEAIGTGVTRMIGTLAFVGRLLWGAFLLFGVEFVWTSKVWEMKE